MKAVPDTPSDVFSSALRNREKRERLTYEQVIQLAELARHINEEIITFLADQAAIAEERVCVTVQLLRASFDHARALLFLIQTNPRDMGAPALALHRMQIESFLRAHFFGFISTQEELDDFLQNDEGVRTKTNKGKWRNIGALELAEIVQPKLNELSGEEIDDPEKITRMIKNVWEPLCGFVHGGKAIRASYKDSHGGIGCDLPAGVVFQIVCNCFVITNFGFITALARIHGLPGILAGSPLSTAMQRFIELQRYLVRLDQ